MRLLYRNIVYIFTLFFCLQTTPHSVFCETSILWEDNFKLALQSRDAFFQKAGITGTTTRISDWQAGDVTQLHEKLQTFANELSPWYAMLMGFIAIHGNTDPGNYFITALNSCLDDPGLTWLLFIEFQKNKLTAQSDAALMHLQKIFLSTGATSVPIVTQGLLVAAALEQKNGNTTESQRLFNWVTNFDHYSIWPVVRGMNRSTHEHPENIFKVSASLFKELSGSWRVQLEALSVIIQILHICLAVFIVAFFSLMFFKYATTSLHGLSENFPNQTPYRLKIFCVILIFLSLLAFGLVAFFWLIAFFIWPYIEHKEKRVLILCLIAIVISPFFVRIDDMLKQTRMPDAPLRLYQRACDESYSAGLMAEIDRTLETSRSNTLLWLGKSILSLKTGDYQSARQSIRHAEQQCPDDPVVLITSGNIYYALRDLEKARSLYEKTIALYPDNEYAMYNIGQYYLESIQTLKGMNYIADATKINPDVINKYIKINDSFFPNSWPAIRKTMPADYSSAYFFSHIFLVNNGDWSSAKRLWGAHFFALPPLISFGIFVLLLSGILFMDRSLKIKRRPKKISHCSLCGVPICNWCKRGVYCRTCYRITHNISNESVRRNLMTSLVFRAERARNVTGTLLNMIFPGTGPVYTGQKTIFRNTLVMAITALIYSCFYCSFFVQFTTPFVVLQSTIFPAVWFLLFYPFGFFIDGVRRLLLEFKRKDVPIGTER